MDIANRDRIAWALMIGYYEEQGLLVSKNLLKELEGLNLGVPIENVGHLTCCLIMKVTTNLPWSKLGGTTSRKPPDNTVWPVFKALVSRQLVKSLKRSDPNTANALSNAVPELARRARLGDAEVSEVLVLAANEILDERERSANAPTAPPPSDDNAST